jgi:ABC-type transport system involved in multi-copper enzyme maturation permease subunit
MRMRWGLGPVFFYEWLTASRRWQLYAVRALFVAILLGALSMVWYGNLVDSNGTLDRRMLARIGEGFFYAIIGVQMAVVLLAAPAATAGSICLDKARGTLLHVLVTDLSDGEIVLGKLGARLLPVLSLMLAALPVLFLGVLLGGIDPEALLGAFLVTLGVAVFGCALALLLSVWGTKTHEVLLAVYGLWAVVLLTNPVWYIFSALLKVSPPPIWLKLANPFYTAFAPYLAPGATDIEEPVLFLVVALVLAAVLTVPAILCIRRVAVRQTNRPARERKRKRWAIPFWSLTAWLPGPSLSGNPVLWREWRRRRPSAWARVIWLTYAGLAIFFSAMALLLDDRNGLEIGALANGLQVSVGLLLLSVGAVTVLAEERTRGSLDVLLTTPLPTRSIVWGKWWGAYRRVPLLAILPTVVLFWFIRDDFKVVGTLAMAGFILALGAAITSLGLAIATWVPRFGRAVGLCVTIYVLITLGWPIMIGLLSALFESHETVESLITASPIVTPIALVEDLSQRFNRTAPRFLNWVFVWSALDAAAAVALFLATVATFDKCLGRITKRGPNWQRAAAGKTPARPMVRGLAP